MREMLLAAAVCGALGLALASLRATGGDPGPAGAPGASGGEAETQALLAMMGGPAMAGAPAMLGASDRMSDFVRCP